MAPKVVTFGEIMLRLNPPGFQRLIQANSFEGSFAGAEANVAVSLANFGLHSVYVTCLPPHELGQAAINYLRRFGVDTSHIVRSGDRIGIYFLETGAVQRPSKVIYDRAHSAIAEVQPGMIPWDEVFAEADWFHFTGITPAISQSAADVCLEAVKAAKERGITISCDLNYRRRLWKYGKSPAEVMGELVRYVDLAIGNEEDAERVFGIKGVDVESTEEVTPDKYLPVVQELMGRFPNLKKVAITLRGSISASHNRWSGLLYDGQRLYASRVYDITHIVDRVGSGDAFAAGLIYSLLTGRGAQEAVDFAVAAGCLKHTMPHDFNLVSVSEVESLIKGVISGRVQR